MHMDTKVIGISFITLLIGLSGGYVLWGTAPDAPAPSGMDHAMDSFVSGLKGKTGDEFDRAFVKEMIVHHEGAVEMAEQALVSASREEIQNLAREIIAAQTREIDMMQTWLHEWYGH